MSYCVVNLVKGAGDVSGDPLSQAAQVLEITHFDDSTKDVVIMYTSLSLCS